MKRLHQVLVAASLLLATAILPETAEAAPRPNIDVSLSANGCTLTAEATWSNVTATHAYIDFSARKLGDAHTFSYRVIATVSGSTATASHTFSADPEGDLSQFRAKVFLFNGEPDDYWSTFVGSGSSRMIRVPCIGAQN